ncbi:precorrin-2 dehydrogenase/sirohydrochlorin ferrochelatase family protein [Halarchaeum sp. P4]|uniref:precorrin-2 dehydrogenase/sirohydrochlorin ferrochelatase family protein n=1 Tax=Halarchaeum sp. P4 TaxID=3421639 RepID=UPI003EBC0604
MIPLAFDFTDEAVLVVGGGRVGARKARRFAREARVVVLSPAFADADFGDAELVRTDADAATLHEWVDRLDPALVVAATDDESVNDAAVAAAREVGALVNRADHSDDRAFDDVAVPATVRDDPVSVAISTGGSSPALAKHLREQVEETLDGAGAMAEVTASLREDLQAADVPPGERRDAVRAVVRSTPVWKALRSADTKDDQEVDDAVRRVVANVIGSDVSGGPRERDTPTDVVDEE